MFRVHGTQHDGGGGRGRELGSGGEAHPRVWTVVGCRLCVRLRCMRPAVVGWYCSVIATEFFERCAVQRALGVHMYGRSRFDFTP